MAAPKTTIFFLGLILQIIDKSQAQLADCGCSGPINGGGYGGYGGCGSPVPISQPITFTPVPQPVPIKIPVARPAQSVTIPNIILALLPPTNRAPVVKPRPAPAPGPITIPIPQPYPVTLPDCGCA